eukprot:CAMPEP_0178910564 /NCGR_PEP_ID=MMETSP0786-20121207/9167_1 /TAXON_ID=186022 /ORGANISM="Thalassionema frauenfeldii, Strain CCMP 1798" /LENGTH=94 /DNA_ID=CAMNT_0020582829 /DNA_START=61 /DNA_END=342 /DNA_ORIENTATION=-
MAQKTQNNIGFRILFLAIGILGICFSVHMMNQVRGAICEQTILKEQFEFGHSLLCDSSKKDVTSSSSNFLRGLTGASSKTEKTTWTSQSLASVS